jgi:nicotinate-nucleotide--dimethylbenzimidazole phosphoribosyltransferase
LTSNKHHFSIPALNQKAGQKKIKQKLENQLTKPLGAFGFFKSWYLPLAVQKQVLLAEVLKPSLLIFCSENGYLLENEITSNEADTAQKMLAILQENNHLQKLAEVCGANYSLVDVGVNYNFERDFSFWLNHGSKFINARLDEGTANFFKYPALTADSANNAMGVGEKLAERAFHRKSDLLILAGLSKGGDFACLVLSCALTQQSPERLIDQNLSFKFTDELLEKRAKKALNEHPTTHDPFTLLNLYGSYEVAALTGAILKCAALGQSFCIDNLASATALLLAHRFNQNVAAYAVFAQKGYTRLERFIQNYFKAKPLLRLKADVEPGLASLQAVFLYQQTYFTFKSCLNLKQH